MSPTIGTPRFEEEIRAFLETRLVMLARVLTILFAVLSVAFIVSMSLAPDRTFVSAAVEFATEFPNSVLSFLTLATASLYFVLRARRLSSIGLALLDAALLQILAAPCLLLYASLHTFSFSGFAFVVPFLVLFVLARAVLIPSTVLRTFFLSLPAPIGVLAIQLHAGATFAFPDEPYTRAHFLDTLVQNQVCLLGAVAVAMVASRVNLSLRRSSYDARHVGQYALHECIGRGAMGEVFLATHSLLKRKTAIKFLRPEIAGDAALDRFEREVKLAASLNHPNTISIFDYGYTAEGVFFYAMEHIDGETLRDIVAASGPMPSERVIHVVAQAASALSEAHAKGIVHRDIKPANIMLCERGGVPDFVKILDFGVAKKIERGRTTLPATGLVAGSLETLAPEALRGGAVGPAADLYSLAVVAYGLASGTPLFEAESGQELVEHHLTSEPEPLSARVPGVDAELEAVVLRGLQKDPARRFPDAAAFRAALLGCGIAGAWTEHRARSWWDAFEPPSEAAPDDERSVSSSETRIRMP